MERSFHFKTSSFTVNDVDDNRSSTVFKELAPAKILFKGPTEETMDPKEKEELDRQAREDEENPQYDEHGNRIITDKRQLAKLSAMAKGAKDGNNNMDYYYKVNAKTHNQITLDSARDKVKEAKEKMTEDLEKSVGDAAIVDTLAETANDHIVYKDYDAAALDQYMEKLDSLSLIELMSLKTSTAKELNRLEACQTMVKAANDLRQNFDFVEPGKEVTPLDRKNAGTNIDAKVMAANYLDLYGFDENEEQFKTLYDTYQPKLEELSKKLTEAIEARKDEAASTKYLTEDFLKVIRKRLNNLTPDSMDYVLKKKSLETLESAFANRTDLSYLIKRFKFFVENKRNLKKVAQAMRGSFSGIASKLNKDYTPQTMKAFANTLLDDELRFTKEELIVFIYFLNYVSSTDNNSNNNAWVKVLILNIGDVSKDIFDLCDPDTYLLNIVESFFPMIHQVLFYIDKHKAKISTQIYMGLNNMKNWVKPKKKKKKDPITGEEVDDDSEDEKKEESSEESKPETEETSEARGMPEPIKCEIKYDTETGEPVEVNKIKEDTQNE